MTISYGSSCGTVAEDKGAGIGPVPSRDYYIWPTNNDDSKNYATIPEKQSESIQPIRVPKRSETFSFGICEGASKSRSIFATRIAFDRKCRANLGTKAIRVDITDLSSCT